MVKKGFSLAEALIVMAVVSIFFSAAAKVITIKPKPQKITNPHGYFECYLDGGVHKQANAREEVVFEPVTTGSSCTFEPPKGVAFFNMNTYGRAYYTSFEPNANKDITITIHNSGDDFIVLQNGSDTYTIKADAGPNTDEQESTEVYFEGMHPTSQIYNGGSFGRNGIMLSW